MTAQNLKSPTRRCMTTATARNGTEAGLFWNICSIRSQEPVVKGAVLLLSVHCRLARHRTTESSERD
jgi:hypothetical protein